MKHSVASHCICGKAASASQGRPLYRLIGGVATAALLLGSSVAIAATYPFRVDSEQHGNAHVLQATNDGDAPVTVLVEISGANIAGLNAWPQTSVVGPRTSVPLGRISSADPSSGYRFEFHYSSQVGDYRAHPAADVAYRLPYRDGEGYKVRQAPGGPITTHTDRRSAYAIDFELPEGTPVVAARDGVVFEVVTGHTFGRLDPALKGMDNHVGVVHADGTVAEYVHFRSGPYVVHPGQRVTAGTLIGYSGNTGYSSGPHLHFAVIRPVVSNDGKLDTESMPVTFRFADGAPLQPVVSGTVAYAGERKVPSAPAATVASRDDAEPPSPDPATRALPPSNSGAALPSDEAAAKQAERQDAAPPQRVSVSLRVPDDVKHVPIWMWGLAAVGLWTFAGLVARLTGRRGRHTERREPRLVSRADGDQAT